MDFRLAGICIGFLLNFFTLMIMTPILPLLILDVCDGDTSKATLYCGAAMAIFSLFGCIGTPLLGKLSDKKGRKWFIFISCFGEFMSLSGAYAVYLTRRVWILFIVNVFAGLCSGIMGLAFSYVADILKPEDRSKGFGILGAMVGLSLIGGPTIGGYLGHVYSYGAVIYVAYAAIGLDLIFVPLFLKESLPDHDKSYKAINENEADESQSIRLPFNTTLAFSDLNIFSSFGLITKNRFVLGMCFVFMLDTVGFLGIFSQLALFEKLVYEWGSLRIGLFIGANGTTIIIGQGLLLKPLLNIFGERKMIILALTCEILSYIPFLFITEGMWAYTSLALKPVGSLMMPLTQGIVSKSYDERVQGKVMSVVGTIQTFSGFLGPVVFCGLFSYFTGSDGPMFFPRIGFYVAILLDCIALAIALIMMGKYPPDYYVEGLSTPSETERSPIISRRQ